MELSADALLTMPMLLAFLVRLYRHIDGRMIGVDLELLDPLRHLSSSLHIHTQDLAAQQLRLGHVLPHRLTRWSEEGALPYLQAWGLLPAEVIIVESDSDRIQRINLSTLD